MYEQKGRFARELYVLLGIGISSLLLLTALWALPLTTFPKNTPAAILHYNVGTGIDFIGQSRQILVLPGIGTILLFMNIIIAGTVKRASRQAFWICLAAIPVVQFVLLIAYIAIWRAN